MARWRSVAAGVVAAATILVVGVVAPFPAEAAAPPFRSRVLVGNGCDDAYSATTSTGITRGVMRCGTTEPRKLVFFTGNGKTWTRVATGVAGTPAAFADDGTSYFAIYAPAGGRGAVVLLRRNHSTGAQTKTTLRVGSLANSTDTFDNGALLVSRGRYWAAFSINNGEILWGRTFTRQNLVPGLPASMPAVAGGQPSLARRGANGAIYMLVSEPPPGGVGVIVRYGTNGTGKWTRRSLTSPASGLSPQILFTGTVMRESWLQGTPSGFRLVYQDNATGTMVRRSAPGLIGSGWPRMRMFMTGNVVTFVYTGHVVGTRLRTAQVVVARRSATSWGATVLAPANDNRVLGAGGWGGRTIVIYTPVGSSPFTVYSRRQA